VTLLSSFHFFLGSAFFTLAELPRFGLFKAAERPDPWRLWALDAAGAFSIVMNNYSLRLNSLGSAQIFKAAVLPAGVPRIAVEMGSTDGWWKYGVSAVVGLDTYGESAPAPVLFKHFGFTPDNVADTVEAVLQKLA
jgi:hypothetical protein